MSIALANLGSLKKIRLDLFDHLYGTIRQRPQLICGFHHYQTYRQAPWFRDGVPLVWGVPNAPNIAARAYSEVMSIIVIAVIYLEVKLDTVASGMNIPRLVYSLPQFRNGESK